MERPRLYYGWVMLCVSMVALLATLPAQTFVVSVFNTSFRESLGLSNTALTGAYMAGTMLAALPMVFVGRFSDRFGPRLAMAIAAAGLGLTCLLIGRATGIVTLFIAFFFLRFCGQGSLALTSGHIIAMWFHRRLGRVEGVRTATFALGAAVVPLLTVWLIAAYDWRQAYAILGVGVWIVVLPLALFVARDRPEDIGQRLDGDEPDDAESADEVEFTLLQAMATRAYWSILIVGVSSAALLTGIIFQLQPLAMQAGLDPSLGAQVVVTYAIVSGVATLGSGWLLDRFGPAPMLGTGAVLLGLGSLLLVFLTTPIVAHASLLICALADASIRIASAPTYARYFGRRHHGAIRGSVTLFAVAGTSVGPFIMGVAFDLVGGFDEVLIAFVVWCVPLAIVGYSVRPPHRATTGQTTRPDI